MIFIIFMYLLPLKFIFKGGSSAAVDLKILLPDHSTVVVNVRKNSTTEEVYQVLCVYFKNIL